VTAPIEEIRAMLLQFERSALRDLYVRSADWTLFMARPGGAANPMLAAVESPPPAVLPPAVLTVAAMAPHLGLFEPRCAVGEMVEAGAVIAVIDVLGRKTEVVSAVAGRVAAVHAAANDLVEYGASLLDIAAA